MRLFKLINSQGETFDLMRKDAFFSNPGGLGLDREINTVQVGGEYAPLESKAKQKVITGTMAFNSYKTYSEFVSFIKKSPLRLGYNPLSAWRFVDCDVQTLTKGEMEHDHKRIYCDINFICYSKWYITKYGSTTIRTIEEYEDRKEYQYKYPYSYRSSYSGQIELTVLEDDAPLKITINGPCSNPAYTVRKASEIVGKGQFFVELTDKEKLVVDANPRTMEASVYSKQGDFLRDVYGASNFETERFLYLPRGKNNITISRTGTVNVLAVAEVKDYEESV